MTNHPKILGDCYKKFNLAHTSKSQNTYPDDIRFRNYILLTPKQKAALPSNCSFEGGKIAHEIVQKIKCENLDYEQAAKALQKKIDDYQALDEKDKIKFDFIFLDPPYRANYHELVLNQIFNCNFIKKGTIVICEHSLDMDIKTNILWNIYDVRTYGQSKLTFLIHI